ncbi:MAG: hypothetical protein WD928_04975 [Gammaproteobacteria bacterium]
MFKLDANPTFTRSVEVLVPADGGHRKETLSATFCVLDVEEAGRYDLYDRQGTRDFLERVIQRLDDIAGEDGKPVPYSDAVRDQVLALPYARLALARAYFEAVAGAARGN